MTPAAMASASGSRRVGVVSIGGQPSQPRSRSVRVGPARFWGRAETGRKARSHPVHCERGAAVKTLPDNPDLRHLRQQARELLAGLRDGDPTTSLSTAQVALARQYGFRTWTDLRAEVARLRGRGPGQVRRGKHGRLVVFGWEHAGGQPPSWELGNALMDWAIDLNDMRVNAAGARALVAGYRATVGALPALDMAMFRGAVTGLANYVTGQVEHALTARDDENRRHVDRGVRHLLTHLPTRALLEQLLDLATS